MFNLEQGRILLGVLRKATEKVRALPEGTPARISTAFNLSQIYFQFGNSVEYKKEDDIPTATLVGYLNKSMRVKVKEALGSNCSFRTLHTFGNTPWETIQEAFGARGIECPLELSVFHAVYREELQTSSEASSDLASSLQTK